ncbi:HMO1 [Candida pseudojiufengensis]|uniref:HMO1 n=1 Tax=Candida pseudojiufengensis TaxID=497109 RepID=UPI002223FFAE|nr:HMO1 [Candida pseudojiufengensis]KAI5962506.1 HMO1 [Candida pseudojiufengensis]
MSEFKAAKDHLVSTLFELSKGAQNAASAALDFYKVAAGGHDEVTVEQLQAINDHMKAAADIANGLKVDGPASKKRKVEKDPNAPKKPLTMFFAFSFFIRKKVAEERRRQQLPNLGAIDMNQMVKERWDNISDEEKAKWQQKYQDEMKLYIVEKAKYEQSLKDGTPYKAPTNLYSSGYEGADDIQTPAIEAVIEDEDDEEETVPQQQAQPVLSQEELKKKRKQEKKEKKKKAQASP